MREIYQYIEFILLSLFFLRTCASIYYGASIKNKDAPLFLFYFIWYTHSVITLILGNTPLTFHFVHCTFPIAITAAFISKNLNWKFYSLLVLIILINLNLKNRYIIDISYLLSYYFILLHIYHLVSSSNRNRGLIPAFGWMLSVLIVTHLIFLFGHVKVDWTDSLYSSYFINSTILLYLSSLTIIHVQFRRFLTY